MVYFSHLSYLKSRHLQKSRLNQVEPHPFFSPANEQTNPIRTSFFPPSIQRLATPDEEKMPGTNDQRMREDKMIQEKPEVQRTNKPEEEEMLQSKTDNSGSNAVASPQISTQIESTRGHGQPLPENTRTEMESGIGADFSGVKVHTDAQAVGLNRALGAQAFTHGNDVYFNSGKYNPETTAGKRLLAHELAHVVQQRASSNSQVQRRAATWLERRSWLSFFDHYIPRMFLNNYMDDTGKLIVLTQQQMQDCNPVVDVRRSPAIMQKVSELRAKGGGTASVNRASGWGGAMTNGSLGNFTIYYSGKITVNADGTWSFSGIMVFYDFWDFDPKPFGSSGRSTAGEAKTRVGAYFIPGRPFYILSAAAPVAQTNAQSSAQWGGGFVPVPVGDKSTRSAADIGTGDIVGGVPGAEIGAQASEDLN